MTNSSIILIDPARLFREGLRQIFSDSPFTVVHESTSIADALPFIATLQPAIVLVDLPDRGSGPTATIEQIRVAAPEARVVVLTTAVDVNRLAEALAAGVDGYLLKNMSADALHQSLRLILLGEKVLTTDLARLLAGKQATEGRDSVQANAIDGLSDREMQILGWLCDGAPNKQIANELKIADGTVKVHIKTILKKIHMRNRTQAAVWAVNHGIAYGGGRGKAHTLIPGSAVLTERADAR